MLIKPISKGLISYNRNELGENRLLVNNNTKWSYDFSNYSGLTVYDLSGNGLNGTLSSSNILVSDNWLSDTRALGSLGVDDRMNIPANSGSTSLSEFTIEGVIEVSNWNNNGIIVWNFGGYTTNSLTVMGFQILSNYSGENRFLCTLYEPSPFSNPFVLGMMTSGLNDVLNEKFYFQFSFSKSLGVYNFVQGSNEINGVLFTPSSAYYGDIVSFPSNSNTVQNIINIGNRSSSNVDGDTFSGKMNKLAFHREYRSASIGISQGKRLGF